MHFLLCITKKPRNCAAVDLFLRRRLWRVILARFDPETASIIVYFIGNERFEKHVLVTIDILPLPLGGCSYLNETEPRDVYERVEGVCVN